jgi:hypothetical protein
LLTESDGAGRGRRGRSGRGSELLNEQVRAELASCRGGVHAYTSHLRLDALCTPFTDASKQALASKGDSSSLRPAAASIHTPADELVESYSNAYTMANETYGSREST